MNTIVATAAIAAIAFADGFTDDDAFGDIDFDDCFYVNEDGQFMIMWWETMECITEDELFQKETELCKKE